MVAEPTEAAHPLCYDGGLDTMTSQQEFQPDRRRFLQLSAAGMAWFALRPAPAPARPVGRKVGCAVIGTGLRGREMLRLLAQLEQPQVEAVCDLYPPYLRRASRSAPLARAYQDYRQALEDDAVEAVFVAVPTHNHAEVTEAALKAGKHVYCEAPMASTLQDCRTIAAAVKAHPQAVFAVGLQNRPNPVIGHASKFLKARAAGRLVTEEGHWYQNNSWRRTAGDAAFQEALNWRLSEDSLGLLGEWGVHAFDYNLRMRRDFPVAVTSFGSIRKWRDGRTVPDTVFCIFEFPDGYISRFEASLANSFREKYHLVNGTQGSILMKDTEAWWFKEADAPSLGWEVYATREKIGNEEGIVLRANATKLINQGKLPKEEQERSELEKDPLYVALGDFIEAASKKEKTGWGLEEGFRSSVMAIKAHESLTTKQRVTIDAALFEI